MTKQSMCQWCRQPMVVGKTGRPRRYCRRSHRQRAYEARAQGQRLDLSPGEIVVAAESLQGLEDRLYVLETALVDARADLAVDNDYRAAYEHLARAAASLSRSRIVPIAVADAP